MLDIMLRERYDRATASLDPPFAVVDLAAFRANASALVRRAGGTPVRVATKSVRVRSLVEQALTVPGFSGVMAYSLPEAVWLVGHGVDDVLMGYPTVDRAALAAVVGDAEVARRITLMVDDVAHLDVVSSVVGSSAVGSSVVGRSAGRPDVRVCIDIDTAWRPAPFGRPDRIGRFGLAVGARRSPVRSARQAVALALEIVRRPGFELVGLMTYEAQIAGVPDLNAVVRWMKGRSAVEIERRRAEIVRAVRSVADVHLVNAGGTGSVELSAGGSDVTEVTAGSGLFGPTLFDGYRGFRPEPAAAFALPVVRRPGPGVATAFGGGYPASGPAGRSRLPSPFLPSGLRLLRGEGAGEVQTPVRGSGVADGLRVGDRVWFRHAKAGELCERFDVVHLIEGDQVVGTVPTYRGEGKSFG